MVDSLYTITGGRLNKPEKTEVSGLPFPANINNTNTHVFKNSTTTGNVDEFTPSSKQTQTSNPVKPRYGARTGVVEKIDEAKERSYTIQGKETLYGIVAREYNLSDMNEIKKKAEEVAARNKLLNKDWIKAGDSLILDKIDDKKLANNAETQVETKNETQKPVNSTPAGKEQAKAETQNQSAKQSQASESVKAEKAESNAEVEEETDGGDTFLDLFKKLFESFSIDHAYGNTFINFKFNSEFFNE